MGMARTQRSVTDTSCGTDVGDMGVARANCDRTDNHNARMHKCDIPNNNDMVYTKRPAVRICVDGNNYDSNSVADDTILGGGCFTWRGHARHGHETYTNGDRQKQKP